MPEQRQFTSDRLSLMKSLNVFREPAVKVLTAGFVQHPGHESLARVVADQPVGVLEDSSEHAFKHPFGVTKKARLI